MPSVLPRRASYAAAFAALTLVASGCAAGQLNQQQKEKVVADAGYAMRNNVSVQAVYIVAPVTAGGTVIGHFVAINGASGADTLAGLTTSLGDASLTTTPGGAPVNGDVTIPGQQGEAAVTSFVIPQAGQALLIGSTFTATFLFENAGAIDVTGTVVDGAPGAYQDQSQEQRGQCLGLLGPAGQGEQQIEGLTASETATPAPPAAADCTSASATPAAPTATVSASSGGSLTYVGPSGTPTPSASAVSSATTTTGTAAGSSASPSQSAK